jgi:predicted HicB family RNase H-like nuclease
MSKITEGKTAEAKNTEAKPAVGKYGAVIQKAREEENQNASEPENQTSGLPESKEEEVNLSIKVSKRLRRHWASEAKRQDTTLTAVIIGALREKFGEPSDQ